MTYIIYYGRLTGQVGGGAVEQDGSVVLDPRVGFGVRLTSHPILNANVQLGLLPYWQDVSIPTTTQNPCPPEWMDPTCQPEVTTYADDKKGHAPLVATAGWSIPSAWMPVRLGVDAGERFSKAAGNSFLWRGNLEVPLGSGWWLGASYTHTNDGYAVTAGGSFRFGLGSVAVGRTSEEEPEEDLDEDTPHGDHEADRLEPEREDFGDIDDSDSDDETEDADSDGVADEDDMCEDLLGVEENQGCPNISGLTPTIGRISSTDTSTTIPVSVAGLDRNAQVQILIDGRTMGSGASFGLPMDIALLKSGFAPGSTHTVAVKFPETTQTTRTASFTIPAAEEAAPDADGDTVLDAQDVCPNTQGVVANHGCPDVSDLRVQVSPATKNRDGSFTVSVTVGGTATGVNAEIILDGVPQHPIALNAASDFTFRANQAGTSHTVAVRYLNTSQATRPVSFMLPAAIGSPAQPGPVTPTAAPITVDTTTASYTGNGYFTYDFVWQGEVPAAGTRLILKDTMTNSPLSWRTEFVTTGGQTKLRVTSDIQLNRLLSGSKLSLGVYVPDGSAATSERLVQRYDVTFTLSNPVFRAKTIQLSQQTANYWIENLVLPTGVTTVDQIESVTEVSRPRGQSPISYSVSDITDRKLRLAPAPAGGAGYTENNFPRGQRVIRVMLTDGRYFDYDLNFVNESAHEDEGGG